MPKTKKTDEKEKKTVKKATGKGEKFADMSATAVVIDESAFAKASESKTTEEKIKAPRIRGKNYLNAKKLVDRTKSYTLKEALALIKKSSVGKTNWTMEAHFNVNEKGLSGEVTLPHYQGKAKKVAVFDEKVAEALKNGKIDFEVLLATTADMPKILPFAKLLGPKGLMPNPKNGTLVSDLPAGRQVLEKALVNFAGNAIRFKTEKDFPVVHTVFGKVNQPEKELVANFEALIKAINSLNIKRTVIKSTMSPGIRISS